MVAVSVGHVKSQIPRLVWEVSLCWGRYGQVNIQTSTNSGWCGQAPALTTHTSVVATWGRSHETEVTLPQA